MLSDLLILAIAAPLAMALFLAIVLQFYFPLALVLFCLGLLALRASWEEHTWILFAQMAERRPMRMLEREKRRLKWFIAGMVSLAIACIVAYQIEAVQNAVHALRWLVGLEP